MQTLYADILFLINFTMDFLTLFITSAILHRKVSTLRLTVSAAIGGLYGVIAVFIDGILIINILINLAVSYLMCLIAFKSKVLPCLALFYGMGCLLGGAMTAFFTFMNGVKYASAESDPLPKKIPLGWMAISAAIIGAFAIAGGRMARKKRSLRPCRLSVETEKGTFTCEAMTDTGNLLSDPISGRQVILIQKGAFLPLIPDSLIPIFESDDLTALSEVEGALLTSIRLIPSVSLGGDKLLIAYIPNKITIDGVGISALIASGNASSYGGYPALVPEILTH